MSKIFRSAVTLKNILTKSSPAKKSTLLKKAVPGNSTPPLLSSSLHSYEHKPSTSSGRSLGSFAYQIPSFPNPGGSSSTPSTASIMSALDKKGNIRGKVPQNKASLEEGRRESLVSSSSSSLSSQISSSGNRNASGVKSTLISALKHNRNSDPITQAKRQWIANDSMLGPVSRSVYKYQDSSAHQEKVKRKKGKMTVSQIQVDFSTSSNGPRYSSMLVDSPPPPVPPRRDLLGNKAPPVPPKPIRSELLGKTPPPVPKRPSNHPSHRS